ncbi:MAG: cytochrome c [Nitrospinota bacterium]|nr:cytochrome c [Nitrospinota bacterium]
MLKKVVLVIIALGVFASPSASEDFQAAERLFKRKCYMCHRLSADPKVGPGLEGVTIRRSDEWLHEWLLDPEAMWKKGDPDALELVNKFKKVMKSVDAMKDEKNRRLIIDYLKENDKKRGGE